MEKAIQLLDPDDASARPASGFTALMLMDEDLRFLHRAGLLMSAECGEGLFQYWRNSRRRIA